MNLKFRKFLFKEHIFYYTKYLEKNWKTYLWKKKKFFLKQNYSNSLQKFFSIFSNTFIKFIPKFFFYNGKQLFLKKNLFTFFYKNIKILLIKKTKFFFKLIKPPKKKRQKYWLLFFSKLKKFFSKNIQIKKNTKKLLFIFLTNLKISKNIKVITFIYKWKLDNFLILFSKHKKKIILKNKFSNIKLFTLKILLWYFYFLKRKLNEKINKKKLIEITINKKGHRLQVNIKKSYNIILKSILNFIKFKEFNNFYLKKIQNKLKYLNYKQKNKQNLILVNNINLLFSYNLWLSFKKLKFNSIYNFFKKLNIIYNILKFKLTIKIKNNKIYKYILKKNYIFFLLIFKFWKNNLKYFFKYFFIKKKLIQFKYIIQKKRYFNNSFLWNLKQTRINNIYWDIKKSIIYKLKKIKKNKLVFFKFYSEINLNEIIDLEIYQLNKIYITHFSQIPAKKIIKFLKKKNKPIPIQKNTYLISQNNDVLLKNLKIFSRIAFIKNFVYKLYGKLYYTEKIKRIRKKKHNFFFFKLLVFLQNTINIDLNNDQYLQNIRDYIRFNIQNKRYLNFRWF